MAYPPEPAFVFRLNDHGQGPELIRQVFLERGWVEFEEDEQEDYDWNLWWRTSRFRACDYDRMYPFQRLNHYPKSTAITRKDSLARNMKRMKGVYGANVYGFSPDAFNLPNDYTRFVSEYTKMKEKYNNKPLYWICKPADLSRGRGIFIFKELSDLQYDCNAVVQQYISNPMLISGYKFDLRIYVLVPSFHPLKVYIYREGLVRFSTDKFDLNSLGNMYSHLTNTSINKNSPTYTSDKEGIGPGCKWTLTQLRQYFRQNHIDDTVVWSKIINVVILTLVVQANQVPKVDNCFELYGFDIMIDENLKPWLLEVNFSPAMSSDCQTDIMVKKPMLHDLIQLLNYTEHDKDRDIPYTSHFNRRPDPLQNPSHHYNSDRLRSTEVGRHTSLGHNRQPSNRPLRKNNLTKLPDIKSSSTSASSSPAPSHTYDYNRASIIPGLGLPSVQHKPSSGRSSSSSGVSNGEGSDDGGERDAFTKRSSQSNGSKRRNGVVSRYGLPARHDSITTPKSHPSLGNTQKRESKVSVTSDSAYSTSSGSSSITEKAQTAESKNLHGNTIEHKNSGTSINGTVEFNEHVKRNMLTPVAYSKQANARKLNSIKGNQTTHRNKTGHMTYTANPLASRHAFLNNPRRNSLGSMSQMTQRKLSAYAKPWRRTKNSDTKTDKHEKKGIPKYVGDFVLVFPVNDTMEKCANGNLDARIVIRECQKYMKERLESIKNAYKPTSNDDSSRENTQGSILTIEGLDSDNSLLWGPILTKEQAMSKR